MKLLLTLIFSSLILLAAENSERLRVQILEKVLSEISINKKIVIWSDNKNILSEIKIHNKFKTAPSCKYATVVILENQENLKKECSSKCIFVLDYNLLSNINQSFGALFWKKGRPNIVIIEPRIKAQSITTTKNLEPYLENKIW